MDAQFYLLHLKAGKACGEAATCGNKVDYIHEPTAQAAAEKMSKKFGRALEAYPCFWCKGWHIGRQMSKEELLSYG